MSGRKPRRHDTGPPCRLDCGRKTTTGSRSGLCWPCVLWARKVMNKHHPTAAELEVFIELTLTERRENLELNSSRENYPAEVQLLTGDWVVCSDVHVPRHSPRACQAVLRVGRRLGVKQLLVAGDIADHEGISRHRKRRNADGVRDTYSAVFQVLAEWSKGFDRIHILKGNHDDRLQRLIEAATEGRGPLQQLVASLAGDVGLEYREQFRQFLLGLMLKAAPGLAKKVVWDVQPQVLIAGPPGLAPYRIVHPAIYSRHAPQAEKRLSIKYTQPVLGTHGHLLGLGFSPSGLHPVAQIGHMTDPAKHLYLAEQLTDHPEWNPGFASIVGGRLKLWSDNPYIDGSEIFAEGGR